MTAPEHLDYHVDINSYIEAKRNIVRFQTPADYAVLNQDYPATRESDLLTEAHVYWVGNFQEYQEKQGCFVRDGGIYLLMNGREDRIMEAKDVALKGFHNLENACSAIMASLLAGASMKSILVILKNFKGLSYRLEYIAQKNGVSYFNDSLATIPEATMGALEALGEDVETLIAGGHDRGLDYSELGEYIAKTQLKTLILFPETGIKIWEAVVKETPENTRPQKFEVTSMEEAVKLAASHTKYGKICLLSPASSSFGLFKNYKERGDKFKESIENL
jgi:UDP-N-acetylmuramoylalanine--D-glutamate ligase